MEEVRFLRLRERKKLTVIFCLGKEDGCGGFVFGFWLMFQVIAGRGAFRFYRSFCISVRLYMCLFGLERLGGYMFVLMCLDYGFRIFVTWRRGKFRIYVVVEVQGISFQCFGRFEFRVIGFFGALFLKGYLLGNVRGRCNFFFFGVLGV